MYNAMWELESTAQLYLSFKREGPGLGNKVFRYSDIFPRLFAIT